MADAVTMPTGLRREVLKSAIGRIPLPQFRELANTILDLAPESFWLAPASSSGRFHPPDERSQGGNVLHTARVMRLVQDLCVMHDLDERETSIVMVAALLHDLYKGGEGALPIGYTWPLHQVAPRFLLSKTLMGLFHGRISEADFDAIFRAVEAHEGAWSVLPDAREFEYAGIYGQILHTADYIASRPHVRVDLMDGE